MAQFDNSNQSFIFTHKGEAKNAVNSDGNIRMHPEYQPELLEGEHFRIKEIDTPRN